MRGEDLASTPGDAYAGPWRLVDILFHEKMRMSELAQIGGSGCRHGAYFRAGTEVPSHRGGVLQEAEVAMKTQTDELQVRPSISPPIPSVLVW